MRIEQQLTIVNKLGLHARAATQLVTLANSFSSTIVLHKEDKHADASSVLGLMMLESHQGETVTVVCEGSDAQDAFNAVKSLVEDKFHEEE